MYRRTQTDHDHLVRLHMHQDLLDQFSQITLRTFYTASFLGNIFVYCHFSFFDSVARSAHSHFIRAEVAWPPISHIVMKAPVSVRHQITQGPHHILNC
jgi:hypothetical protein